MKQNTLGWMDLWKDVWGTALVIFAMIAIGWLYQQFWGTEPVEPVPIVRAEAVTSEPTSNLGARDQLLSSARHVVTNWREADAVMATYNYDEYKIKEMLATNEIIVVMPRCKAGHPWIDQTKVLIRYSCEGPMP